MPVIKCKEASCPHDIVYVGEKVISLMGGGVASLLKEKEDAAGGEGSNKKPITRNLTLECILKHRHNYSITFEQ